MDELTQREIDAAIDERFRPFREFHDACVVLFFDISNALHIPQMLDWLVTHRPLRPR